MPYFVATQKEDDWTVTLGDLEPLFPLIVHAASLEQACDIIRHRMKNTLSTLDERTLKVAELTEMGHFSFDNKASTMMERNTFHYNDDKKPSHGGTFNVLLRSDDEIEAWEKQKYHWIDPDLHKPAQVKENKYLAVRREAAHKTVTLIKPCHSKGLEHIDGDDWELFHSNFTLEHVGITFYYGMFVEGMGWFNVMVAQENVRELTDAEKVEFSGKVYGMYGSTSGNLSYTTSLPEMK